MSGWQPIETAPRDGSLVLLYGGAVDDHYPPSGMENRIVSGWFEEEYWSEGMWRHCTFDSGIYGCYENPTHWQPLPPAPVSE